MTISFPPTDVVVTGITKKDAPSGLPAFKTLPTIIDPDREETWGSFLETTEGQVALYDHLLLHFTRKITGDTTTIERLVANVVHDMRCSGQRWQLSPAADTIRRELRELRIMYAARLHGLSYTDVDEQMRSEAHVNCPEMAAALKVKAKKKPAGSTPHSNNSFRGKQHRSLPRVQCRLLGLLPFSGKVLRKAQRQASDGETC
eukprot:PhM_4_TR9469/c1_g1_i1/m.56255